MSYIERRTWLRNKTPYYKIKYLSRSKTYSLKNIFSAPLTWNHWQSGAFWRHYRPEKLLKYFFAPSCRYICSFAFDTSQNSHYWLLCWCWIGKNILHTYIRIHKDKIFVVRFLLAKTRPIIFQFGSELGEIIKSFRIYVFFWGCTRDHWAGGRSPLCLWMPRPRAKLALRRYQKTGEKIWDDQKCLSYVLTKITREKNMIMKCLHKFIDSEIVHDLIVNNNFMSTKFCKIYWEKVDDRPLFGSKVSLSFFISTKFSLVTAKVPKDE